MGSTVIGLDVGGTAVKATLLDEDLGVIATRRTATPRTVAEVLDVITTMSGNLATNRTVDALGVVVPGIVDEQAGVARYAGNLGWRDVPFGELLAERCGLPVAFGHDVRAGGLAEARLGAARGMDDVAFVPVGTGIAAALLVGGSVLTGGGYAGEFGHIDVGHEEPCACGATGCLEAIASCSAIARRYTARSGRAVDGSDAVFAALHGGDALARSIVDEALTALGNALRTLITLFAPQTVVLGGGLGASGELVLEQLRAQLSADATFQRLPQLRAASLGDQAGCIGAGLLAREVCS